MLVQLCIRVPPRWSNERSSLLRLITVFTLFISPLAFGGRKLDVGVYLFSGEINILPR